ncbi:MAG: polysaccharide biosynthesis C-terminal domain-containing protein [Culicoidibacterales bacterium]
MSHKSHKKTVRNSFASAAMISTVGLILTRVISVIYVIPYSKMTMNTDAATVYNWAFYMYLPFYELSLAGLPFAIARLIAMYNAKKEYTTSNRVLKYSQIMMLIMGTTLCLCFIAFSGVYASFKTGLARPDLYAPLQQALLVIAPSLILIPLMSGMRGYLQGFQSVTGVAISQVVEQIVRVSILLVTLYVGIYVWGNAHGYVMSYAMVSIPFAGLAAIFIMIPYYRGVRRLHLTQMKQAAENSRYKTKYLIKQIALTAIPFVLASFATTLYGQITNLTFENVQVWSGVSAKTAELQLQIIAEWSSKLVAIPLTFSMALSFAIISFITGAFEGNNTKEVRKYTVKSYGMTTFFTLGSVLAMITLAVPLVSFFYGTEPYHLEIAQALRLDGFRGVLFAFEVVTIAIMQGLGQKNKAVLYSYAGPVVKLALNIPLVYFLGIYGDILATIIGLLVVVILCTKKIIVITSIKPSELYRTIIKTAMASFPMVIVIIGMNILVPAIFPTIFTSRVLALIYIAGTGLLAIIPFLYISDKIGLLQEIFGKEITMTNFIKKIIIRR